MAPGSIFIRHALVYHHSQYILRRYETTKSRVFGVISVITQYEKVVGRNFYRAVMVHGPIVFYP
jgi:hypothetical protein